MTYGSGGLIQVTDYNNFLNGSNQLNTVWSTGTGNAGYGQTALTSYNQGDTVTATQWASLINTLNNTLTHQGSTASGITAMTRGNTITYLSTLSTSINTAYTNRLNFSSNAAVVAGSQLSTAWTSTTTNSTISRAFGARAAFASADQARYFFNAGGRLKLNTSGTQNASTTGRTNDIVNLLTFLGGVQTFGATTNGGRAGAGGTLGTNDTTKGYWTSTYNANVTLVSVTSTTAGYTTDTANITVICNGSQGSNSGNGLNVDFWINLNSTSGANAGGLSFDDSFGVNVIRAVDVSYPESTNLSNTWGAVTISSI